MKKGKEKRRKITLKKGKRLRCYKVSLKTHHVPPPACASPVATGDCHSYPETGLSSQSIAYHAMPGGSSPA